MIRLLVFILSFLGLLAGIIISFFTREELKPGRKYFILLEKALLLSISLSIIFYLKDSFLFLIIGFLIGFIFRRTYFYLGLALPFASESFLTILSSLIFIFGLPHGTLIASKLKKKDLIKQIICSGIFFFSAVLFAYFLDYKPLLMITAGALITISVLDYFRNLFKG